MYALYTILLVVGGAVLLPRLLWRCLRGAAYHRDLPERFAYGRLWSAGGDGTRGCLWFHAASVGEVQGLQPLVKALHTRFPALPVVFSTFTPTGKSLVRRLVPEATLVFLLPFDLPWTMWRLVQRLRPRALIVQETELWPQLLRTARRQRVPVVIVNGRLSPRAFRRYGWIRPLMRRVFADTTLLLVQTEQSAQRFRALGAPPQRVRVVGNTNIDRALAAAERPAEPHPLAPLGRTKRLLVGGSTHEGEESILLAVYGRLYAEHPDLLLVLAPRHLERVGAVGRQIRTCGCRPLYRSQCDTLRPEELEGPTVLVLDTMGELAQLYSLCTVAFVGGSLVPIGGHNILEPAVFAKPLLFGPYMQHFPELAAMLCAAGGAVQVQGEADLYAHVRRLLAHPAAGRQMGEQALHALQASRGALERTVDAVVTVLGRFCPPRRGPQGDPRRA